MLPELCSGTGSSEGEWQVCSTAKFYISVKFPAIRTAPPSNSAIPCRTMMPLRENASSTVGRYADCAAYSAAVGFSIIQRVLKLYGPVSASRATHP